jgi:hypothetical protein
MKQHQNAHGMGKNKSFPMNEPCLHNGERTAEICYRINQCPFFSRQPTTSTGADQRRNGAGGRREGGRGGRRANLVRLGDLLELGLGLLLVAGVLVRVPLHGQLPVRLLELVIGGAALHLQHLVVVHTHPRCHGFCGGGRRWWGGGRWGWVGEFFVRGDSGGVPISRQN